jgi:hypothetical protein
LGNFRANSGLITGASWTLKAINRPSLSGNFISFPVRVDDRLLDGTSTRSRLIKTRSRANPLYRSTLTLVWILDLDTPDTSTLDHGFDS